MGGFFGVASKAIAVGDLSTERTITRTWEPGARGWRVRPDGFARVIHNIENDQFRSKFDADLGGLNGRSASA